MLFPGWFHGWENKSKRGAAYEENEILCNIPHPLGQRVVPDLTMVTVPEDSFYTRTPFDFVKWDVAHEDDTRRVEPDTWVHPSQGISRIGGDDAAVSLCSKGLRENHFSFPCKIARMDYVNLKGGALSVGETDGKEAKIVCPAHKIVTVCLETER